jgi:hypothetical protein
MRVKTANTGRKVRQIRNPDVATSEAQESVRKFHGREPKGITEIIETEEYDDTLPVLGQLLELNIMTCDGKAFVPIVFCKMDGKKPKMPLEQMIQVCADKVGEGDETGHNLYFKSGNQCLDMAKLVKLDICDEIQKDLCIIGPIWSIAYFTDKSHLEGPEYQKKGAPYEHQFGEEADKGEGHYGEQPVLIYDSRNERLMLSGGSYEIRPNGIWN